VAVRLEPRHEAAETLASGVHARAPVAGRVNLRETASFCI
jgi:hypothetical protein